MIARLDPDFQLSVPRRKEGFLSDCGVGGMVDWMHWVIALSVLMERVFFHACTPKGLQDTCLNVQNIMFHLMNCSLFYTIYIWNFSAFQCLSLGRNSDKDTDCCTCTGTPWQTKLRVEERAKQCRKTPWSLWRLTEQGQFLPLASSVMELFKGL